MTGKYQPTIGLEVHSILKTRTKMFCDSVNDPEEREPNKNTCPVCLGHPGCLPVANREAIEHVIRVGFALGGKINPVTKFDRKNYFYPDLPKGYQISQYDQPFVVGGELLGIRLRRIHLEEDAGKLLHGNDLHNDHNDNYGKSDPGQRHSDSHGKGYSLVDFNRAGVPLMELVTEPDFRSAEQVMEFAKELQRILRYLDVSGADMEKGQMRIEANVSLDMGPKVELKNINSFRAVSSAIAYELARQQGVLESGGKVVHETRGWNEPKQETYSQRSKEEAHDYRYFPDPDLPPFETASLGLDKLRISLPELPAAKRERFRREFGLGETQAAILIDDRRLAEFFEQAASELGAEADFTKTPAGETVLDDSHPDAPKKAAHLIYNYLTSDLLGFLGERGESLADTKMTPENLADLVALIAEGRILSRQAKDVLRKCAETGEDPRKIVAQEHLETISEEGPILAAIGEVIVENGKAVEDYKKGKEASVQFMVGQAMKKLKSRGNPERLRELLKQELTK